MFQTLKQSAFKTWDKNLYHSHFRAPLAPSIISHRTSYVGEGIEVDTWVPCCRSWAASPAACVCWCLNISNIPPAQAALPALHSALVLPYLFLGLGQVTSWGPGFFSCSLHQVTSEFLPHPALGLLWRPCVGPRSFPRYHERTFFFFSFFWLERFARAWFRLSYI